MVNNTVKGKKIGNPAGKNDKVILNYCICGKQKGKGELDAKANKAKPSIHLIGFLREQGQIDRETKAFAAIKAYPGGNPNKGKQSEEVTR